MEKNILVYSYWLGMLCALLAVVWRAASMFGFFGESLVRKYSLSYTSFFKGAVLFLLIAVATYVYQAANRLQEK